MELSAAGAVLLFGRALEGVGAAMIAPNSLAIIVDGFSGRERGQAVGTWAAAGAGAGALVRSSAVSSSTGRAGAGPSSPSSPSRSTPSSSPHVRFARAAPTAASARRYWLGAGLAGAGVFALIWASIAMPERGATRDDLGALAAGLVLLAAFLTVSGGRATVR